MSNNPLISVIVPAYNVEKYISRCLDSILNQTYKNLEIIVIDDGSTDNTSKIIKKYSNKDKRIVPIFQDNIGLVLSREKGIQLANGEYLAFVDSDDYIIPEMYEKLLKNIIQYNAEISHCGVDFIWKNKCESHYGTGRLIIQNNFDGQKDLLLGDYIEPGLWNKLYKKELLENSCLDTSVLNNEDLLRNFILFQRSKKSVYEDFCGYKYVQREGSMSKDRTKTIQIARHVMKARELIVENSSKDIYPYAMRSWLSSIINSMNSIVFETDNKSREYYKECKNILKKEKKNLHFLIKRQYYLSKIILSSKIAHKYIYKLYKEIQLR